MIYSVIEIIGYIFNKKDIKNKEQIIIETNNDKIIETTLIENKKNKKKKIK